MKCEKTLLVLKRNIFDVVAIFLLTLQLIPVHLKKKMGDPTPILLHNIYILDY